MSGRGNYGYGYTPYYNTYAQNPYAHAYLGQDAAAIVPAPHAVTPQMVIPMQNAKPLPAHVRLSVGGFVQVALAVAFGIGLTGALGAAAVQLKRAAKRSGH